MTDLSIDRASASEKDVTSLPVPFEIGLAVIALGLCLLYALLFSRMVYDSAVEEILAPHVLLPRYAGAVHHHNSIEWVLLVVPAAIGWLGVAWSGWYLLRRWLDR